MTSVTPRRRARHGSGGVSARVARLLFGDEPRIAVCLRLGLIPMFGHLIWGLFYADAARSGAMGTGGAAFMLATNAIGIVGFYPLVRGGATRGMRDCGLVLPQMLWGSLSVIAGIAFAPSLRASLLQVLCMSQVFGFLSLRPGQLLWGGCTAIACLLALLGFGASGAIPGFDAAREATPALLSAVALLLLMRITIEHSRRRQLLVTRRAELGEAVAAVQQLAIRDALTGVYNRRHMEALLADERARSAASGSPFSVALLDIDHFKRINDDHGHAAGDAVLREFADTLARVLRSTDTLARWGGEEFLVLAPAADVGRPEATLQEPLERLRALRMPASPALSPSTPPITFSGGLAAWRPGESAQQTIARADAALYAAKADGRDRLVACTAPQTDVANPADQPVLDTA